MAQRGRPKKIQTENEVKMVQKLDAPAYRHMITFISKQNVALPEHQIITAAQASAILNEQYEQFGYVVDKAFHIGDAGEGAVGVLYVLRRGDVEN